MQALPENTADELSRIAIEMDALSKKITTRVYELNSDMITTRTDPIVSDLWRALCRYHRKAIVLCGGMGDKSPSICAQLVRPQVCVEALHLPEEWACCEIFLRTLKQEPKERHKVKYAMSSPVVTIDEDSNAAELVRLLRDHQIGSAIVLHDTEIKGIVTEKDLVSKVFEHMKELESTRVETIMTRAPLITIGPDDELQQAAEIMSKNNVRHLPVVYDGGLMGMLAIADFYKHDRLNLV